MAQHGRRKLEEGIMPPAETGGGPAEKRGGGGGGLGMRDGGGGSSSIFIVEDSMFTFLFGAFEVELSFFFCLDVMFTPPYPRHTYKVNVL